jgi:hypothetical protein
LADQPRDLDVVSVVQLGELETAAVGALAGGITAALTCPLDTIRARTMNEAGQSAESRKYDGPLKVRAGARGGVKTRLAMATAATAPM